MEQRRKTVEEIRSFNRFYTVYMGFLDAGYLDSGYSIAETRILFELRLHKNCIQNDIVKLLRIDKSYLSRLIGRLCRKGLVEKKRAKEDKRAFQISLTEMGNAETERLIELTNQKIESQIEDLNSDECDRLQDAFQTIITILGDTRRDGHEDRSI